MKRVYALLLAMVLLLTGCTGKGKAKDISVKDARYPYRIEHKKDTCLVTVVADQGSAPRGSGARMLVGANGRIRGTIGGEYRDHGNQGHNTQDRYQRQTAFLSHNCLRIIIDFLRINYEL